MVEIQLIGDVIVQVYSPFRRKRIVLLSCGQDVRTRLVVVISKVSGPPVFHIKVVPLNIFPKEPARLISTTSLKFRASSREVMDTIF